MAQTQVVVTEVPAPPAALPERGCQARPAASSAECRSDSSAEGCQCAVDPRMDFIFRCNHCIKLIGQDSPVFMGHDLSYCSDTCRRRGRSALYSNLKSLQLERLRDVRRSPSESATSAMSTAMSESSLASSGAIERTRARRGPLGWVIGKVVDAIYSRLPMTPLVQAASAAVLSQLGQLQPRPGSSVHRLLGYLPEAHSFVGMSGPELVELVCRLTWLDRKARLTRGTSARTSPSPLAGGLLEGVVRSRSLARLEAAGMRHVQEVRTKHAGHLEHLNSTFLGGTPAPVALMQCGMETA
eukprot:CAMPEP_0204589124 /NCGR_PEP_ID=MMETSP0661-20131031/49023_1 /ASSEMBLY_ACC=CAM_ASM_000606 /TAXON_ID=109239 /ORGANISM="Alexandrium margalefi, Strain AMGDE01CS-322" /LENGTH=297 /DNA_ID=CAMNT_0051599019 /DNA_START=11 /DNA_END=903 /DNA_ORIENTATION=+